MFPPAIRLNVVALKSSTGLFCKFSTVTFPPTLALKGPFESTRVDAKDEFALITRFPVTLKLAPSPSGEMPEMTAVDELL